MDPQKVAAILDWTALVDKKGIQRFANFYRKFMRGFSAIISPITQLTKQGIRFDGPLKLRVLSRPIGSCLHLH